MTEHYSGHDPVRGCACMMVLATSVTMLMAIGGLAYLVWSSWPR